MELQEVSRLGVKCPVCGSDCYAAAGRGLCQECFITFSVKTTRKQLLSNFSEKFYMSKHSGYYHRKGCKYIKNINSKNIIEVTEPAGKACRCAR